MTTCGCQRPSLRLRTRLLILAAGFVMGVVFAAGFLDGGPVL